MKTATRLLALSVLASGAVFTTSAFACSTDAWTSVTAGATPGDPNVESIQRFAGKCGLEVTGTGHVVDNTPSAESTFIARFYFFGKNIGAGLRTIFGAYSADNGSGEVFNITYDGTDITVNTNAASGGSASAPALSSKWNVIEVSWEAGSPGYLWVNADATSETASATFNSGTGSIESIRLGAISDIGTNNALFDDYVSHRTTPIGTLVPGDANGNGSLTISDVTKIYNELNGDLATGQPDCNLSGAVTIADVTCLYNKL